MAEGLRYMQPLSLYIKALFGRRYRTTALEEPAMAEGLLEFVRTVAKAVAKPPGRDSLIASGLLGPLFTCFTSTEVQILALLGAGLARHWDGTSSLRPHTLVD